VAGAARVARRGQTGNMRNYAEIVGVGVVLLLAWFVVGRGVL
jgi:NADH-quinone oxidoreductase subunit L